jgi:hypothetical protein
MKQTFLEYLTRAEKLRALSNGQEGLKDSIIIQIL